MKGDYSRQTFQPEKYYDEVLMQQGRVLLDAEFNEQQAIHRYRLHTQTRDEIGKCGAPKPGTGFQIVRAGSSFKIMQGRYYVHGLLCQNDTDWDYTDQNRGTLPPLDGQIPTDGIGLVYLEAYQTQVTALQDPYISEKALRIPDTTNRLQTVWQVRVLPLPGVTLEPNEVREKIRRGDSLGTAWDNLVLPINHDTRSKLIASTKPVDEAEEAKKDDSLCVLSPTAGYRGLTNRLYRVEIHRGTGETGGPSFKWSSENASIMAQVTGYSGSTIQIKENARVDLSSFPINSWVELTNDVRDRNGQPGLLARVTPTSLNLTVSVPGGGTLESVLGAFDASLNPRIILWDEGDATYAPDGNGILIEPGHGPYVLEAGIQAEFKGICRPGDYWLIPARVETGQIEWKPYHDPTAPREEQAPAGTQHYFCPLAIIYPGTPAPFRVEDCRLIFPSLNFIEATDVRFDNTNSGLTSLTTGQPAATVQEALDALSQRPQGSGHCDITISGGSDIEAELAAIPAGKNAHICISVGDYAVKQPIYLRNLGSVTIVGAGRGTRLLGSHVESVFVFENCTDVQVQDMTVISGEAGTGATMGLSSLNGTLTFRDCASVTVENIAAACGDAWVRSAACITVSTQTAPAGPIGPGTARIRSCDLTAGFKQVGILLLNVPRAQVEDNTLHVGALPARFSYQKLLASSYKKPFLKFLRRRVVSNIHTGPTPPVNVRTNVTLNIGTHPPIHFYSPFLKQPFWDALIAAAGPVLLRLRLNPLEAIKTLAEMIILEDPKLRDPRLTDAIPELPMIAKKIARELQDAHETLGDQGIVVAGLGANDVRILNNTIEGYMQGIHIGFDGSGAATVRNVLISGNAIDVWLRVISGRERHAIYIGNCESLTIENNHLACFDSIKKAPLNVDGIHLEGQMGRRMLVRQNHIIEFTNGVFANPLIAAGVTLPPSLWTITDNVTPSGLRNSLSVMLGPDAVQYETNSGVTVILRTPNYK